MKKYLLLLFMSSYLFGFSQNTALQFDGSSEFVSVPYNSEYSIQQTYTIEAWIYANNWASNIWQGSILNSDAQGPDRGFAFRCGDNGKLSFVMAVDNEWNEVFTSSFMNTKQWHHVATVIDNGNMFLYIDGQQIASATYDGTPSINTASLNIGASPGFGGRFFDGIIDEIRIWNIARSASELADNKTTDLTGGESGLIAYYPMNEGSGSTLGDLANGSDATTVGMDDSNWVSGYTLPDFDVSVQSISGIDRVHMKKHPVRPIIKIQNVGTMDISNIQVTVSVDGSEVISESISNSLSANSSLDYVIKTPISLVALENPEITVSISHPDDANSLNNEASLTITTKTGNFVSLFDRSQHNFGSAGQNQYNDVVLPSDLSKYKQLLLHIKVDCPTGGCDPWDQTGKLIANTPNGSYEIARYITPYGIACGDWVVDVTDFKSILSGPVSFNSFVQVWGPSGWLVTMDLELIEGDAPIYSSITPLWQDDYQVYGDPGISHDLEAIQLSNTPNGDTETSHIRMTITGHGQGNTNNAAEFYNVNHSLEIDGQIVDIHNLWKADCAANSCDDQAGNWLFARAGWCPGEQVTPKIFNTTDIITDDPSGISVDYVLQDYTNLLNTGYNSSGHTEPHYRIHSFFVENSSSPYELYQNMETSNLEVSTGGAPYVLQHTVKNNSISFVSEFELKYYVNNVEVGSQFFNGASLNAGESHTQNFSITDEMISNGLNTIYAEVVFNDDQDSGDDILGITINSTSVQDIFLDQGVSIQPNPTSTIFTATFDPSLIGGQLTIFSIDGRILKTATITTTEYTDELELGGTYFLQAIHPKGYTATQKLVIIK